MNSRAKEPVVIREQDVKPFVSPLPHHRTIRVLLSALKSPVEKGVAFGVVEVGPGQVSPPHHHETEQEAWYVISGRGSIRVGDKTIPVEAGTVVVSPPQMEHQITNPGPDIFKAIFMFSPSGPEAALFAD
jgi:mannose-6-phosphate isomerase-like protein (cupin superfamily)